MNIVIFKAQDGKWTYCPEAVRNQLAFNFEGEFGSMEECHEAYKLDKSCRGHQLIIEEGK